MAQFWVTFRLESNANYQKRYDDMLDALVKLRNTSWGEPTSFWLVDTDLDIDTTGRALIRPLNANTDLLVIRELGVKDARYFGKIDYLNTLKSFLPYATKL